MSDHDDLYRYLAALERCSMEEIIEYLHGLEDDELGSFIEKLANVFPFDSFETESLFNYTVDSTLAGGSFPCSAYRCRERNVRSLAEFSVLYADKVLLQDPIDRAFNEHDGSVDIDELAFAIYIVLRLKPLVLAGIVGFVCNPLPLCSKCLAKVRANEEAVAAQMSQLTRSLEEAFVGTTVCTLNEYESGEPYVSISGMEAFGSDEIIDVDFRKIPEIINECAQDYKGEPIRLDASTVRKSGLTSLLDPIVIDTFYSLTSPTMIRSSYLTTRAAQASLMSDLSDSLQVSSFGPRKNVLVGMDLELPTAQNASIDSLLAFRESNLDSFKVFRDTVNSELTGREFCQETINEIKLKTIDPEINKINLMIKNNRQKLLTRIGTTVALDMAIITIGSFSGLSTSDVLAVASLLGGGPLLEKISSRGVRTFSWTAFTQPTLDFVDTDSDSASRVTA